MQLGVHIFMPFYLKWHIMGKIWIKISISVDILVVHIHRYINDIGGYKGKKLKQNKICIKLLQTLKPTGSAPFNT